MKKNSIFVLSILAVLTLGACTPEEPAPVEVKTYYEDKTSESIYGKLSEFSIAEEEVKVGDTLTFKVTPSKYFNIDEVTNNNKPCRQVSFNEEDGTAIYQTTIVEGKNSLKGTYAVDPTIDFVDEFKLNVSDTVFDEIIKRKQTAKGEGDMNDIDFRKSGIEQCRAPMKFDASGHKVAQSSDDAFINYVDGDTTHVETFNLKYTVKIRYLSIDTPESTSEIEEWGLSASYYSKYIYSGDEQYKQYLEDSTDFTNIKAGATSLILVSQEASIHAPEIELDDLQIGTSEFGKYAATTDGNQRNLAYVWYATVPNPTKDDFRCLNLEMVYQGFSFGIGSMSQTSEYYYKMFDAANLSAKANRRHLFSGLEDENYYYYNEKEVNELSLEDLYLSSKDTADPYIKYYPDSPFANKKTLYKFRGYVTRKLGTAFYMQDKLSYTDEEVRNGKCFGIYVFTYAETPIKAGDEVELVGAVSVYGGTYQIQGVSWKDFDADPNRDIFIKSRGNKITPVKLSGEELNRYKLPSILVELTDNVYFYDFKTTYQGNSESIAEGGSEEVNKYNDSYPFYNTSNSPIFYGSYGDTDNAKALDDANSSSQFRYSDKLIRFTVDQNILVKFSGQYCYSWRFFCGGSYDYNANGAQYANFNDDNEYKDATVTKTFKRKSAIVGEDGRGLIVISHGYESTGGNKKMTATICANSDVILTEMSN